MTGTGAGATAALPAALHDAVDEVASLSAGARSWDAGRRRAVLAEVDRAIATLTTIRCDLLLAERDSGDWRGSGDPSFAAWRGRTARIGPRGGLADERRAQTLTAMPDVREATLGGAMSVDHVDVIGQTAARGSQAVRDALDSADGQARVLEMARRLDAGRFATALARLAASVDAAHVERTHQAQRAERYLHLAETPTGTLISGRLDTMTGHRVRLALEALSPRPAIDDDRSHGQRTADALEAMAEAVLGLPATGSGAAVRPHVSFVMDADTWAALRAARARTAEDERQAATAGDEPPVTVPPVAVPPVTLEDGTPVPTSEVARALCDCELTRIVLDAQGEPIDLGRTARTYTGTQRRAVIARDGGCAWDGCAMAARWCEVHHSRWWDRDGGETSVENGVLVCSFHHHELHRLDLTVRRRTLRAGEVDATTRRVGYVFSLPDGRVLSGAPPGATPSAGRAPRVASAPVAADASPNAGPERAGVPRALGAREQLALAN